MPVRYCADLELIQRHVDHAAAFGERLDEALARLDATLEELHLSWTGDAAAAHRQAHAEWAAGTATMRAALAELAAAAGAAHESYRAAIEANLVTWGPLR